jgi:hypothetical protein
VSLRPRFCLVGEYPVSWFSFDFRCLEVEFVFFLHRNFVPFIHLLLSVSVAQQAFKMADVKLPSTIYEVPEVEEVDSGSQYAVEVTAGHEKEKKGTCADQRDMARMGKRQEMRVSCSAIIRTLCLSLQDLFCDWRC